MPFPIEDFIVQIQIPVAGNATGQVAFIAPFDCDLVSVEERHRVASTSGTLDVVVAADATAVSAGTSLLSGTMSLAGTADTKVAGALVTTVNGRRISKGSALGLKFAGTLTNLVDADITIRLRQVKKF